LVKSIAISQQENVVESQGFAFSVQLAADRGGNFSKVGFWVAFVSKLS